VIVVDASALLEALAPPAASTEAAKRLFGAGESLHAPHLIDIEVTQVVRRHCAAGDIDSARAAEILANLAVLPMRRYPHGRLLSRVWELRHNLTAYDAAYIALAEALDAPLVSRDGRLAAAPGHRATVELI
jgi:predicted nucleic acid-binding protein